VVFNPNLQAVVISDGFGYPSQHTLPALREILTRQVQVAESARTGDLGTLLAQMVKRWRPELDVYLTTDRDVARLAGSDEAAPIRRVFYGVEEPMEIHLAILDGVKDRYETPYFDNLKRYAQRPIGTFHALPVARGKSIFKSNWIRDMGEFYGANLFLAESSATTGGLDSLLEPTGNIKVAQDKAARALGGDRSFFVTNGTSTSNKIVHQALLRPGDIVLIDRDCHKSHHYGLVLAGAQPLYIDAFPLTQYSMYGSLAIQPIKKALLQLKAEGKLDRAKMVVLTNCTFDGHVANVKRTMLECLAIKPDLVFLWDEAWFGFARFSPFLRRRTGMGAAAAIRGLMRDPEYRKRYEAFKAGTGKLDPKNPKLLDMELLPDPDRVRVRVYETDSVHKSMSSLRQGPIIVVADQDFHTVEPAFKEAFFTHTSTSPNLQIIASLDVARRQMELEGYELVGRAIQLAIEIRRQVNGHPLISKYFRIATPAEMIPAEYRKSGFTDWGAPGWTMTDTMGALDNDEFYLDPTRITLLCGAAGYDGTQFKAILASEHDIQINKTSRNSVLVQININNTRSDLAHLIKALADMARAIETRLAEGGVKAFAFLMFLFAVGYGVGPQFVRGVAKDGLPQALFVVVQCLFSLVVPLVVARAAGYDLGYAAGMYAGSQTISASMGLATDAINRAGLAAEQAKAMLDGMPIAYAVTYLFGTVGSAIVIALVGPALLRLDLVAAAKDYEDKQGGAKELGGAGSAWHRWELRAFRLRPGARAIGLRAVEAEALVPNARVFVERIRRGDGTIEDATADTVIREGDVLAIVGPREVLVKVIGENAQEVDDPELLSVPVEGVDVYVTEKAVDGQTLAEVARLPEARGVFLRRITRGATATTIPILPNTTIQRGDILNLVGRTQDTTALTKRLGVPDRPSDVADVAFIGWAVTLGALVGALVWKVGGVPLTLSTAGGALISGIVFGWPRSTRPFFGRIPSSTVWFMNSVGLNIFIAIVGISAGPGFVNGLRTQGVGLFVWGIVATTVPLILGMFAGKYVFRFHDAILLGAVSGARTTTASLGMVCDQAHSQVPALGYTVTYAVGNTLLTIWGMVLIMLLS
jgi:aspartate-alanine antiporter